jgi:hypothetical protein
MINSEKVKAFIERGEDPYGYLVDQLHKGGIKKVLGNTRMNDHHGQLTSWTKWEREHIEWSLGKDTGDRNWSSVGALRQMDYAINGVRDYRLSIIEEFINRYDVDGIQLDFARTAPFVSDPKMENSKYVTEYIKQVRRILDSAASRKNRKERMMLGAIVPWDMDYCMKEGLDVKAWITNGLVDYISPAEWHYSDWRIPNYKWVEYARMTNCKIYPVCHGDVAPIRLPKWYFQNGATPILKDNSNLTEPMISSLAELIYSQGADGIGFYNFYTYNFNNIYPQMPLLVNASKLKELPRQYYYCRKLKYVPTEYYTFKTGEAFDRPQLNKKDDEVKYDFRLGTDLKNDEAIVRFKMKHAYKSDTIEVIINYKVVSPIKIDYFAYTDKDYRGGKESIETYFVSIWQTVADAMILKSGDNQIKIKLVSSCTERKDLIEIADFEILIR